MGERLSGKEVAVTHKQRIKETIAQKVNNGVRPPSLVSIIVGEDGGSVSYTRGQKRVSEEVGISYEVKVFSEDITEDNLIKEIQSLNEDKTVDGIILQLPLPEKFKEGKVIEDINPAKDVDGLTSVNFGNFFKSKEAFVPCTARGVLELVKSCGDKIEGKKTVVVGRSNIVGKPVAWLFMAENATVTICHSKTVDLEKTCKNADILISAIGKPGAITKDFVKEGAIVIDVGTTMVEGKVKGDVDFENVIEIAKYLSPVPGGVGAMTSTMLMKNTCDAWMKNV